MAAATRLLFALARDNMIVGSGLWKRVHPHHQIPRNAIWLVWGLNAIFVVVLTRIGQFDVVTSLSTIAGYLGYAGIVAAAVRCPTEASPGHFRLGVLRLPIALMALAWTLGLVAVLVAPLTNADQPYVPLVATVIGLTVGVLIYVVSIRARIRSGQAGPPLS
jgi:amino acid transporter